MIEFVTRTACPICGSDNTWQLINLSFKDSRIAEYLESYYSGTVDQAALANGHYTIMRCAACGSLYQQHILNDAGMDALYENWILAEGSFRKKHEAPLSVRTGYARQAAQIVKAINRPPHQIQVLDFGMGWGTWLLMARAFGMETEGLELSPKRVKYAQSNGLKVVTAEDIAPETYDFINAEQVFEHLPNPSEVMLSCYKWLKPNGMIRIAVPDGVKISRMVEQNTWKIDIMQTIPLEHINTFTPDSLRSFGEKHGFRIMNAPLVLPAISLSLSELKQFLGVLIGDIAGRLNFRRTTVVWFVKRDGA